MKILKKGGGKKSNEFNVHSIKNYYSFSLGTASVVT